MPLPDWVPDAVRKDLGERRERGEFAVDALPQSVPGTGLGLAFRYPGAAPYGTIHVWVGRSEFLDPGTGEPAVAVECWQELPEQRAFWEAHLSARGRADGMRVRAYTGYAVKANRYMRGFLEQGISVSVARERTRAAFADDVRIIIATLLGSGL
jgi:hypothetical protein